jgi:SPP1 gp7 family putative phage head morphogenesis protein
MTPVDRAIVKIGREQFDTAVIQAERLFLAAIGSTGRSEAFAQLLSEHESGMVRDQTVEAVKIPMQSVSVVLNNLAESAGYSALAAVEFTIPDWMIAKAKVTVDFDPNTTAMRQIISNEVSGMTTLLDASTADSLRIVLARGTQMSWTPDQMSRALKQTLGLDPRYTLAAENYRQGLINKGTKPGVVNKLTSEYTQRLRKNRAETIVRTEVQRVLVAAQEEAWSQAERNLGVRGNKVWLTAEDEMSCSICAPMHGAEANVGGVFSNGLNPPAHPNCRCAVSLRFPMPTTLKTAIKKGDKPGHPFRGNQWTSTTLHRGVNLPVSDKLMSQVRDLLRPPMKVEDIDQHEKIGALLLEQMDRHVGAHSSGIGRHWTTERRVAEQAQGSGLLVVVSAKPKTRHVETDGRYIEHASMEHEVTLKDGITSGDIDIVDVQIDTGTGKLMSVWPKKGKS